MYRERVAHGCREGVRGGHREQVKRIRVGVKREMGAWMPALWKRTFDLMELGQGFIHIYIKLTHNFRHLKSYKFYKLRYYMFTQISEY